MMRRRLANAYASSIISITLVLLLVSLASVLIVNARNISNYFKENLQVSVLMHENVSEKKADVFRQDVEALDFVKTARLVSREEGAAELKAMLGEDFLDVFESSPVPVSVDITLYADYVNPDSLEMVRTILSRSNLVDEVECRQSLVDILSTNLTRISIFLGIFILLMLFISFVLINNTVRLNVFSRRFTVHTMKLVGATRRFIRKPFMLAGLVQGLVSSLLALAVMYVLFLVLSRSFPQIASVFTTESMLSVLFIVIGTGVFICLVSTAFVVNKLISLDKDDLYY